MSHLSLLTSTPLAVVTHMICVYDAQYNAVTCTSITSFEIL